MCEAIRPFTLGHECFHHRGHRAPQRVFGETFLSNQSVFACALCGETRVCDHGCTPLRSIGGPGATREESLFEAFSARRLSVQGGEIAAWVCGDGPPLLLLHGYPQTHAMWHLVAPELARDFTVVCPDLPGYGDSSKPPSTPGHEPYSKRAVAGQLVEAMRQLGFERFALAGHDRGARVAYRLALDHPDAVAR